MCACKSVGLTSAQAAFISESCFNLNAATNVAWSYCEEHNSRLRAHSSVLWIHTERERERWKNCLCLKLYTRAWIYLFYRKMPQSTEKRFDMDKAYGALIEIISTHSRTHSTVTNSMNSLARKPLRRCGLCDCVAGRGWPRLVVQGRVSSWHRKWTAGHTWKI